jgi:hypothetical protein
MWCTQRKTSMLAPALSEVDLLRLALLMIIVYIMVGKGDDRYNIKSEGSS